MVFKYGPRKVASRGNKISSTRVICVPWGRKISYIKGDGISWQRNLPSWDLSLGRVFHAKEFPKGGSSLICFFPKESFPRGHFFLGNLTKQTLCHNLSLRFMTKARVCKVAGQEGSPGVTLHAPRSVRKCEGMNPHTPKGASTLRVWVSVDFQIFKGKFQGPKLNGLRSYLYNWKALGT